MRWDDTLLLAFRNLREARLRAALTTMGVAVGVTVIVTMVSFGLGLQRNTISRFAELDLFNEITVFGRSLTSLASTGQEEQESGRQSKDAKGEKRIGRVLNDAAIDEIQKVAGVASVEPIVFFNAFVSANNHTLLRNVGGAITPNASSRFREFAAGGMFTDLNSEDAVVDSSFIKDFGFAQAADAINQKLEFLAPPRRKEGDADEISLFGLPLGSDSQTEPESKLVARTFRIVGVLKDEAKGAGRNMRGLVQAANIYIPLPAARSWTLENRSDVGEVALALARAGGTLSADDAEGYATAIVRVSDPSLLGEVRKKLDEQGFNTFSILDQIEQIRTFFLIINSVLGLLGGTLRFQINEGLPYKLCRGLPQRLQKRAAASRWTEPHDSQLGITRRREPQVVQKSESVFVTAPQLPQRPGMGGT